MNKITKILLVALVSLLTVLPNQTAATTAAATPRQLVEATTSSAALWMCSLALLQFSTLMDGSPACFTTPLMMAWVQ